MPLTRGWVWMRGGLRGQAQRLAVAQEHGLALGPHPHGGGEEGAAHAGRTRGGLLGTAGDGEGRGLHHHGHPAQLHAREDRGELGLPSMGAQGPGVLAEELTGHHTTSRAPSLSLIPAWLLSASPNSAFTLPRWLACAVSSPHFRDRALVA